MCYALKAQRPIKKIQRVWKTVLEKTCCSASTASEKRSRKDDGKRALRDGIMRCSESTLVNMYIRSTLTSSRLETRYVQC